MKEKESTEKPQTGWMLQLGLVEIVDLLLVMLSL